LNSAFIILNSAFYTIPQSSIRNPQLGYATEHTERGRLKSCFVILLSLMSW